METADDITKVGELIKITLTQTVTMLRSLLESGVRNGKLDYKSTRLYRLKLDIVTYLRVIHETSAGSSFYCTAVVVPL